MQGLDWDYAGLRLGLCRAWIGIMQEFDWVFDENSPRIYSGG